MPFYSWLLILLLLWIALVVVPSLPGVRCILAAPLIITDEKANGDAAYLLAGGNAFRERLAAAVDLYHMGRVSKIIFIKDNRKSSFNFSAQSNWTPTEWAVDFLQWRKVPAEKVYLIEPEEKGRFGTLSEARTIANALPKDVQQLVLVTSAAHTRRTLLAFRRNLPSQVTLIPYAATAFRNSLEMFRPLWLEYLKLFVYAIIA